MTIGGSVSCVRCGHLAASLPMDLASGACHPRMVTWSAGWSNVYFLSHIDNIVADFRYLKVLLGSINIMKKLSVWKEGAN